MPNHVWGLDITYIRLHGGWMYLVAILDWYSRYIVSWELDQTLQIGFVLETMQLALVKVVSQLFTSDQVSTFTISQYTKFLLANVVCISSARKMRAPDILFTARCP